MEKFDKFGMNTAQAEVRARSLAQIGCKDPAELMLEDIRLICKTLIMIIDQQDDIVLQSCVPPSC